MNTVLTASTTRNTTIKDNSQDISITDQWEELNDQSSLNTYEAYDQFQTTNFTNNALQKTDFKKTKNARLQGLLQIKRSDRLYATAHT